MQPCLQVSSVVGLLSSLNKDMSGEEKLLSNSGLRLYVERPFPF